MTYVNVQPNSFIKRQTKDSPFSYSTHAWDELARECSLSFEHATPGYRDGVVLVPLSPVGIFSGVCLLEEGQDLVGKFEARREGEDPRKTLRAAGASKAPAQEAFMVLYSSIVLAEDGDNELPAEEGNWEMVSLNSSPTAGEMPINPMVLMHNHFGSDGGTATGLSTKEFETQMRQSFLFWRDKAMCG
jgi:hypothetical protein